MCELKRCPSCFRLKDRLLRELGNKTSSICESCIRKKIKNKTDIHLYDLTFDESFGRRGSILICSNCLFNNPAYLKRFNEPEYELIEKNIDPNIHCPCCIHRNAMDERLKECN